MIPCIGSSNTCFKKTKTIFKDHNLPNGLRLESKKIKAQFLEKNKKWSYSVLGGVSYRLWLWNCDFLGFNFNFTLLKHQSLWSYCLRNKTWCLKRKTKFSWICHSLCVFYQKKLGSLLFGTKCLVYRSQELKKPKQWQK